MTSPDKAISTDSLQQEGRTFPPAPEILKRAHLNAAQFAALYQRSLREPDAEIRAENRMVRAVTRDGVTITGRLLNQDTFALQLIDSNERLLSLEKANLREYAVLKNSQMPSYRDRLSVQEMTDLVSYLVSLRGHQ